MRRVAVQHHVVMRSLLASFLVSVPGSASLLGQAPRRVVPKVIVNGERADLSGVAFLAICSPAGIMVGLPKERTIRRFAVTGLPSGSFGRSGAGPGEIVQLGIFPICQGDSLIVVDNALRRFSVVGPDMKLARTGEWPGIGAVAVPGRAGGVSGMVPRATTPTGIVMGMTFHRGPDKVDASVVRMDWDGSKAKEVISTRLLPSPCIVPTRGGGDVAVLFCAIPWHSVSPRGTFAAAISATREEQDRGSFRIRIAPLNGGPTVDRVVTTDVPDLSEADLDIEIERIKPSNRQLEGMRPTAPRKKFPHSIGILVGDDGVVWVEHRGKGERRWTVLDRTGRRISQIAVQVEVRLLAVTGMTAYGVRSDGDGFESIVSVSAAAMR